MTFKEWLKERIGNEQEIEYSNPVPYDSYDRWFAVYLIESNSDILKINALEKIKEGTKDFIQFLSNEEKELFDEEFYLAYDNYEREGISKDCALANMLDVINQGIDKVMTDSYSNGGWFGAS